MRSLITSLLLALLLAAVFSEAARAETAPPPLKVPSAFVWSFGPAEVTGHVPLELVVRCGGHTVGRWVAVKGQRHADALDVVRNIAGRMHAGSSAFRFQVDACTSNQRATFLTDLIRKLRARGDIA